MRALSTALKHTGLNKFSIKNLLLFIVWSFIIGISADAQTVTHITTLNGLSTNNLTQIIRDHNNYMWIGSYSGLHKHEGSRIKVYNKIGKDSASMSANEMHTLFEDRQGFIWAGTVAGLDKVNPVNGFIKHYPLTSGDEKSPSIGYIISITQDKYDFIGTHGGGIFSNLIKYFDS